ncbi:putative zinc-binding metallopeptidase [Formosa sp. PL04]|uniref:zinc-binding metallopeptidase family protein n=1 Tax=Formosa sp. PL04 TaxID=3081755 RepID=UPI0029817CFC|nr:putative zinc-binding metallopeptidase [Formosa sp. PL04]MDW5289127.1 putative zinc-binding metallopeptidase [Formosa sp. PL04]
MKIFQCSNCDFPVFFENTACESCGSALGYLDSENEILANNSDFLKWSVKGQTYTYCKNKSLHACNWLVPINHETGFCTSCDLNRTIPDLSVPEYYERWQIMEIAKHRLIYALQRLELPIISKFENPETGLFFDFLSKEDANVDGKKVMTGHANGVITILLAEADTVSREQMRISLNEKYRTLIGHFRHEVGHYYWDRIFANENFLSEYRNLFGDERKDYGEALKLHYKNGAPKNWKADFISTYASSHPWEDWAETWAHYLHILDAMETAFYFGLEGAPNLRNSHHMRIKAIYPYKDNISFQAILDETSSLFYAVNSINRSMGITDVYPFVVSDKVKEKLEFIHQILQRYKKESH